jgi:hypothetical protein
MTHLVSSADNVGALRFAAADTARAFDFSKTLDGVYGRRMILLSPEARRRERLPNIVFRPTRPPMDDASQRDPVLSMLFLVRSLLIPPEYARSMVAKLGSVPTSQAWREHGRIVLSGIPGLMRFGADWLMRRVLATRKLPSIFLHRKDGRYPLEFNAEHMPNEDSRVLLGNDTDPFGMPRLVVQCRFRDTELDAICRAYRVLASALARSGLGEVQLEPDLPYSVQRALVPQGGHHIGTVRMGADASVGVIDTHGQVWGTHGLFVAGTAILPTSSFANPTLTAVALAFRLAEHLIRRQTSAGQALTAASAPSRSGGAVLLHLSCNELEPKRGSVNLLRNSRFCMFPQIAGPTSNCSAVSRRNPPSSTKAMTRILNSPGYGPCIGQPSGESMR